MKISRLFLFLRSRPRTRRATAHDNLGRRRGFTLIELLVVIAIISVLAALLVPSLREALERSRAVACAIQLRGNHQALILYTQDHDQTLPERHFPVGDVKPVLAVSNGIDQRGSLGNRGWVGGVADQLLDDYIGRGAISALFCPSDSTAGDPGEPPANRTKYSYAWNTHLTVDFGRTYTPPGGGHHFWQARPLVGINPRMAAVSDRNFVTEYYESSFQHMLYEDTIHVGWFHSHPFSPQEPGYAHLGKANIAFVDGHVVPMDRDAIFDAGGVFWYGEN